MLTAQGLFNSEFTAFSYYFLRVSGISIEQLQEPLQKHYLCSTFVLLQETNDQQLELTSGTVAADVVRSGHAHEAQLNPGVSHLIER